jgi:4-amino-4-deoxy-L-arabinose transferase-like glycosyltransferase
MMPDAASVSTRTSRWHALLFWLGAAGVLLLGILLWATQTSIGAPFVYHPDEPPIMARAMSMVKDADPNPRWFRYPTLYFYVQALGVTILRSLDGPPLEPGAQILFEGAYSEALPYYIMGRWISIAFGAATALLVMWMTSRVAGRPWAIFGGFVFVTSGLALASATTVTVDMPLTFFVAAATCSMMRLADPRFPLPSSWHLVPIVALGALAAGAKYNGALVLLPFAVVLLIRSGWSRKAYVQVALCALLSVVLFLCTTPYAVLDFGRFWSYQDGFLAELHHYSTGHMGADQGSSAFKAVVVLLSQLSPLSAFAVGSLIFTRQGLYPVSQRGQTLVVMGVALVMVMPICLARVFFPRNCLVIAPHVVALSCLSLSVVARAVYKLFDTNARSAVAAVVALGAVAFHASAARSMIGAMVQIGGDEDPRTTAFRWAEENLPPNATVLREAFSPHVH